MSNYKLRIVIENKSTDDVSFTLFILPSSYIIDKVVPSNIIKSNLIDVIHDIVPFPSITPEVCFYENVKFTEGL